MCAWSRCCLAWHQDKSAIHVSTLQSRQTLLLYLNFIQRQSMSIYVRACMCVWERERLRGGGQMIGGYIVWRFMYDMCSHYRLSLSLSRYHSKLVCASIKECMCKRERDCVCVRERVTLSAASTDLRPDNFIRYRRFFKHTQKNWQRIRIQGQSNKLLPDL